MKIKRMLCLLFALCILTGCNLSVSVPPVSTAPSTDSTQHSTEPQETSMLPTLANIPEGTGKEDVQVVWSEVPGLAVLPDHGWEGDWYADGDDVLFYYCPGITLSQVKAYEEKLQKAGFTVLQDSVEDTVHLWSGDKYTAYRFYGINQENVRVCLRFEDLTYFINPYIDTTHLRLDQLTLGVLIEVYKESDAAGNVPDGMEKPAQAWDSYPQLEGIPKPPTEYWKAFREGQQFALYGMGLTDSLLYIQQLQDAGFDINMQDEWPGPGLAPFWYYGENGLGQFVLLYSAELQIEDAEVAPPTIHLTTGRVDSAEYTAWENGTYGISQTLPDPNDYGGTFRFVDTTLHAWIEYRDFTYQEALAYVKAIPEYMKTVNSDVEVRWKEEITENPEAGTFHCVVEMVVVRGEPRPRTIATREFSFDASNPDCQMVLLLRGYR